MNGIALVFLLIISNPAQAEMFKCVDDAGSVSFQGEPCSDNQVTEWQRETEQQKRARESLESQQQNNAVTPPDYETPKEIRFAGMGSSPDEWEEISTPDEVKMAIMDHLNTVLNDPDSLKDLEWVQTLDGIDETKTLLNYRATNAYGGYIRSEKVIRVNRDGKVIGFEDYVPLPLWMQ